MYLSTELPNHTLSFLQSLRKHGLPFQLVERHQFSFLLGDVTMRRFGIGPFSLNSIHRHLLAYVCSLEVIVCRTTTHFASVDIRWRKSSGNVMLGSYCWNRLRESSRRIAFFHGGCMHFKRRRLSFMPWMTLGHCFSQQSIIMPVHTFYALTPRATSSKPLTKACILFFSFSSN